MHRHTEDLVYELVDSIGAYRYMALLSDYISKVQLLTVHNYIVLQPAIEYVDIEFTL